MTPGTSLWAIKQLLDGKKIKHRNWDNEEYIHLVDNDIECELKLKHPLGLITDNDGWQLWTPPNPYPTGTFAWAWEELVHGNRVRVQEPGYDRNQEYFFKYVDGNLFFETAIDGALPFATSVINVALIKSTNWKLA